MPFYMNWGLSKPEANLRSCAGKQHIVAKTPIIMGFRGSFRQRPAARFRREQESR